MMNDIITSLNLSKICKIIRVIDTRLSIVMSQEEIRTSVRMLFQNHVSYDNIKNLNANFWRNIHESWCFHLLDEAKKSYDLSNYTKISTKKRGTTTTSNINTFHGRFCALSALRSPYKLKICNCSHHHHSESTIHKGSMIEVFIPESIS